jgi:hypothetical protein
MNFATTILFYLLFGVAVGAAIYLSGGAASGERWFRSLTAILFWPLYLPVLLRQPAEKTTERPCEHELTPDVFGKKDEISIAIRQVEAELDLALGSLEGWADAAWSREERRFEELRAAWYAQAAKIRELDALLEQPTFVASPPAPMPTPEKPGDRVLQSERARRENIARLRAVRQRLHDDLINTLAWVRELVTMIHLAKYTGAPASRAEELVLQIATAVEGLSEVASWKEEDGSEPIQSAACGSQWRSTG